MLGTSAVIAFVPAADAARARVFYEEKLGLTFVNDDGFAVVMEANGTMLRIVRVGEFTPAPFTILGWEVEEIHSAVAGLAAQGVEFARYPHIEQSTDGVWSAPGGAKVAWFGDSEGNVLSLSQH